MGAYDPKRVEEKWQRVWEKSGLNRAKNFSKNKKYYVLIEFPYISGEGLHVGHVRSYTALDVIARKRRGEGKNVLYPIGWDAFGLPAENYAVKTGVHPKITTQKNIAIFRKQLKALGISFDWSREIDTTDPSYYKWTQWIFLQLFKRGLAYKKKMSVNWCPKDLIGLANEEVVGGRCERCGTPVEKREREQWMLSITKYAARLEKDLDKVNYEERIKVEQRNWIGRSEGAEIGFKVKDSRLKEGIGEVPVFTTRADTLYGATYLVLAPELLERVKSQGSKVKRAIKNSEEVAEYIQRAKRKTDLERTAEGKEKTGIEIKGIKAVNPASGEEIPVFVADYVLPDYGTGAIMAVPAHDERDFEFARKYGLPIRQVVAEHLLDPNNPPRKGKRTVKRRVVQAVIKHWKEDKILALKWKKRPWTTFVIGGAEEGESPEEAVTRELKEETGFKNFRVVRRLGWKVFSEFFAAHKDENRYADMELFYVELLDGERDELNLEEREKHEIAWIPTDKMTSEIDPCSEKHIAYDYLKNGEHAYAGEGILINSGKFDGMDGGEAREKMAEAVGGKRVTKYKLRDWVFSRQRYWGEPTPIIYCRACFERLNIKYQKSKLEEGKVFVFIDGLEHLIIPVPEEDLPVKLPDLKDFKPLGTGESPLARAEKWVKVRCPLCQGEARRETDVMPNWAGSSWYYLAYLVKKSDSYRLKAKKLLSYWLPVDWYNGGMEHTTLHLLYSRFWHKFLFDIGAVPQDEPYAKRTSHGLVLAEAGEKMSKSKGNVVNPDEMIKRFGADTLRLYEMFMGPFADAIRWNTDSMVGCRRFLEKVWRLAGRFKIEDLRKKRNSLKSGDYNLESIVHRTIKKVGEDIETLKLNTAVSSLMILVNRMEKEKSAAPADYEKLLRLLAPFAPHLTEELWQKLGHKKSIHLEPWPRFDSTKVEEGKISIVVEVNGRVRATITVAGETTEEEIRQKAMQDESVAGWLKNKEIKRVVYVNKRLINFVAAELLDA